VQDKVVGGAYIYGMVVLEVLGVALWSVLGLGGVWWLLTGRRLFGLPKGQWKGWTLRVMGLAYVLLAVFLIYQVFHGSFAADGVVFGYALFAVAIAVYLYEKRKARIAESPAPES
jgi:hypothetical protein